MRPQQAKQILECAAKENNGIVVGEAAMFPREKAWLILILQIVFFPLYLIMYWSWLQKQLRTAF